jgi:hypothetical protein
MILIVIHHLWINADMTENNLGNVNPGVLDVMPGEVLRGRIRSVGSGVSSGQEAQPGTLPTITTAAIGCVRHSASPWRSNSTHPNLSDCVGCDSGDRRRCWSMRVTMP